jgi:hypothetical protein
MHLRWRNKMPTRSDELPLTQRIFLINANSTWSASLPSKIGEESDQCLGAEVRNPQNAPIKPPSPVLTDL